MASSDFAKSNSERKKAADALVQNDSADKTRELLAGHADNNPNLAKKSSSLTHGKSSAASSHSKQRSFNSQSSKNKDFRSTNSSPATSTSKNSKYSKMAGTTTRGESNKTLAESVENASFENTDIRKKSVFNKANAKKSLIGSTTNNVLKDTELEGLDQDVYQVKGAVRLGKKAKSKLKNKSTIAEKSTSTEINSTSNATKISEKSTSPSNQIKSSTDAQRQAQMKRLFRKKVDEVATEKGVQSGTSVLLGGRTKAATVIANSNTGKIFSGMIGAFSLFQALLIIIIPLFLVIFMISDSATSSKSGSTIMIPEPYGSVFLCEQYDAVDGFTGLGMASGTGQEEVWNQWKDSGAKYTDGIATIDGRFLIACTTYFGNNGDKVDFYLSDNTVLHCIIGDAKNYDDPGCNKYGHQNGANVVEFLVDPSYYRAHGNPGTNGWDIQGYPGINDGTTRTIKCTNLSRPGASGSSASEAVNIGMQHLGAEYVFGATGPNVFDCSGFVLFCLQSCGYDTGSARTADQIYRVSTPINESDLAPGDIIVFRYGAPMAGEEFGHIGLYVGDGQMIHTGGNPEGVHVGSVTEWGSIGACGRFSK